MRYGDERNAASTRIPARGFQSELTWFSADGTQFGNFSSGCASAGDGNSDPAGALSAGFNGQGLGDFTASGSCTAFCGTFDDQDNGNWAVDILNVDAAREASPVPEPATFPLTASGISLVALAAGRRFKFKLRSSENTREY